MDNNKRESDTDLQRGFEPLRTIFAIVVLMLGFVAAARAQSGPALPGEDVPGAETCQLVATIDHHRSSPNRVATQ